MACSIAAFSALLSGPGCDARGALIPNASCLFSVPFSRSRTKPCSVKASLNENEKGMTRSDRRRPLTRGRWKDDPALGLLGAWDPFSAGSLQQMIDTMDRIFDTSSSSLRSGIRTPWDVIEDEEGFHLRVDLPGFSKDDVKVTIEDGVLTIKGERQADAEENDRWKSRSVREFKTQVALPDNAVLEEIKAEMKNGVLTVMVPKVKPEEKKSVMDVKIS